MRLKVATSLLLALGFALMLAWPWALGPRPTKRAELVAYSRRSATYLGSLIVAMVGAGVGAVLVIRQAREDYRRQASANMKLLLEGAIEDQRRREAEQNANG